MKILFLISGFQIPASRFRILPFVPYLEQLGHECHVAASRPPKYRGYRWLGNRLSEIPRRYFRLADLGRAWWKRFDCVYLERELFSTDSFWLEKWFRRVVPRFILDIDDAVFLQHPAKMEALARMSDEIVAGNPLLAEWAAARNPRTTVIPTVVDLTRYTARPPHAETARPIIGWTGLASNTGYLEQAAGALRRLAAEMPYELRIISEDPRPLSRLDLAGVNVRHIIWREASELDDLRQFDIGLMPLPDDDWSRYKCGLKLIQYLALGIPAVASPQGVNSDIAQHGTASLLATSEAEWHTSLHQLLTSADLRQQMGTTGRNHIAENYSLQSALPKFLATVLATK